jgi:hypothetical protein
MKNKNQFRQGDVLIERVQNIKTETGKSAKDNGRVILAHGEVTGHAHEVMDEKADIFHPATPDDQGMTRLVLKLGRDAQLKHQEHAPIPLVKGTYRVTRQREYSPEAIRNVAD